MILFLRRIPGAMCVPAIIQRSFFSLPLVFFVFFALTPWQKTTAGIETIPAGSYIVNMGITPQTVANGLKPYGLVYDLVKNYNVPVKWVISQTKAKDGIDFTYNSVSYKGGTFIIPGQYINATITARINYWTGLGVVANTVSTAFNADVTYTLTTMPFWVMDAQNGKIAEDFVKNAGIPTSSYIFKDPSQLGYCDDIYVMPHADPTWATHKNLWYWNLNYKGAIWAGCHAVSVMENTYGPDITNPAITRRLNFLMQDGPTPSQNALIYNSHKDGSPPYTQQYPNHPIMQFMGKSDGAHTNGSEQIFMPYKPGGAWRNTTWIGEYDPTQDDVPSKSDGPAATVAFGRGFGDDNRGLVLYEGGHDIGGTSADYVAAQRIFLNFSFLASFDRAPIVTINAVSTTVVENGVLSFSANTSSSAGATGFTYQWSSACGGTFSNPTGASTTYTAPMVSSLSQCIITCKITDNCGRTTFDTKTIVILNDNDGDGIPDYLDIDDDNDGITDYVEACGAGATSWSCTPNNSDPSADDDNDGIVNYKDADWCTLNAAGTCTFLDTDGDGVPDYLDRDSDNDGIPDVIEAGGVDENGDGIIDNFCDTDSDGLSQNVDANNTGAAGSGVGLGSPDFDGDGVPNYKDLDSDNDGIPDLVESYGADTNNDGRVDNYSDSDGDGWTNQYDGDADGNGVVENLAGVLILSSPQNYGGNCSLPPNGKATCYTTRGNLDNQGLPNFLDLDSDGDGITDAEESGITAASYFRGMVSGCTLVNGWCSSIKNLASLNLRNTDNVGRPDVYDIDSDNDGITDNIEAQPTYSFVMAKDLDTDGDGVVDVYDSYNGLGANGITPYDFDFDGIPDYRDLDSDNDGAPDRNEGDKKNANLTQATINASGDTDGDGLMDYFDIYDNAVNTCNLGGCMNVSMGNMGPSGNFNGLAPGGSNVQLVKSQVVGGDRDWRNIGILPLQIISFTGNMDDALANLYWKVGSDQNVKQYVIERSSDATNFKAVATVASVNQDNKQYNAVDNLSGYGYKKVYYRIRQVMFDGEEFLTHVISFNLSGTDLSTINVFPNPVRDHFSLAIKAMESGTAEIEIIDGSGKVITKQRKALQKGDNKIEMDDLISKPKGIYIVKVILKDQLYTQKIMRQ